MTLLAGLETGPIPGSLVKFPRVGSVSGVTVTRSVTGRACAVAEEGNGGSGFILIRGSHVPGQIRHASGFSD
jgi:hypothetical protein